MPFKAYTADQVYDLLASADCMRDIIEIAKYLSEHTAAYSHLDNQLFTTCIILLQDILT